MNDICKWLPKRILLPNNDFSKYKEYEDELYDIFLSTIYGKIGNYKGKTVNMRKTPETFNRYESFYHIICDKQGKDIWYPNLERASRILWGKAIIEHNPCEENECECSGLLSWDKIEGNKHMHKILFKDKKYLVILEERKDYWLYITSYYIENSFRLRKLVKEYYDIKARNALHE